MPKAKSPDELSYELAFEELQSLIERLEGRELPLEESITLFERGQALAARCSRLLDDAELRLRQLMVDEEGTIAEADLDLEAEEDE
jgi:exodeoxyribonuclease VII small subunit